MQLNQVQDQARHAERQHESCHLLQAFVDANWWLAWTSLPSIAIMAWLLAPQPLITAWWIWLGLMYAQSVHMLVVMAIFRRRPLHIDNARWRKRYLIETSVFAGLCWGSSATLLWAHISAAQHVVLLLYMAGVSAIAGVSNASLLEGAIAFLSCAWLPIIVQLVGDPGDIAPRVLLMCVLFVGVMYVAMWQGTNLHRKMVHMLMINQRLLAEVTQARQAAEIANAAKDQFLGAVSHDLRQPAYALALLLRTAAAAPLSTQVSELIDKARAAVSSMRGMLDALLDLTRVQSGSIPLQREPVAIAELFAAVQTLMVGYASARGIQLSFRALDLVLYTNRTAITRILGNLIENAIRYTDRGRILIAARRRGQHVLLQVWDTGIGIPDADRERIFETFVQIDNPQRDWRRGLGLGLTIVRHLATGLGHDLSVNSRLGRGTVIGVRVPTDSSAAVIAAAVGRHSAHGFTVLIIDDDSAVREAATLWLTSQGYRTLAASDVYAALSLPTIMQIDAAIVDYRLADVRNGAEQLADLCIALQRTVPALIVTGDTHGQHLQTLAKAGHRVLFKPLDPDDLQQALSKLLAQA